MYRGYWCTITLLTLGLSLILLVRSHDQRQVRKVHGPSKLPARVACLTRASMVTGFARPPELRRQYPHSLKIWC